MEVDRRNRSCHHQYMLKPRQCKPPALDERPAPNAAYNIAAICQKCRTHLDLEVNYPNLWQLTPCPNATRPFHHLVYRSHSLDEPDGDASPGKGPVYNDKIVLECSWPECAATLYVKMKRPMIKKEIIQQLVDPELLSARQDEAIKTEPQKMEGMVKAEGYEVLSDLRTYIRNAGDRTKTPGNTGGKIQLLNKRFMMRFGYAGMPCRNALEAFGFVLTPGEYWDPPHPNFDDNIPFQDPFNIFLDDVDHELTILMQQHPPRLRPQGTESPPTPALKELSRILGSQNYDRIPYSRTHDMNTMEPWYRGLGVTPDVSDAAILYAYERQCATDPDNAHRYLDYLRSVAHSRQSEPLQVKFVTEESAGKVTATQVFEAYQFFGLDARYPPTDENYIIGVFSSRIADAPIQESDARSCLKTIGTQMNSQRILDVAEESLTTYEQALAFLDVTRDTADDFITASVAVKLGDDLSADERRSMEGKCQKAVKIIADHRHSLALSQWLSTGELGNVEMDIGEAYSLLGIDDRTLDDQMILTTYQLRLEDNKNNTDTYNQALRAIARHKSSIYLEQYLSGNAAATELAPPNWPVGLSNIGNTCYLNSLLQFCFTIKGIRDIVLNFEEYRMDINGESLAYKKVGSRTVSLSEVQRSQHFAEELQKLFQSMITTPRVSITPEERLARLTLIGPSTYEAARRRSTLHGQPPLMTSVGEVAAADPESTIGDISMSGTAAETVKSPVDATLNTAGGFSTHASSEATLTSRQNTPDDEVMTDSGIEEQQEQILNDKENLPPSKTDEVGAATTNQPPEAAPLGEASPSKINTQAGYFEQEQTQTHPHNSLQTVAAQALQAPNRPPPIPPRPKPLERKSTIADLEDITKQQDVTEVMSNVLFQLSCAIKPTAFDKDGEQVDQIKDLFFGKTKTTTLERNRDPIQEIQRFSDIKINVADGPRDIYQALEAAFDVQDVISNGNPALQFSSISQLPPIFQVQVQRTQFDVALKRTYKSINHLELFQTIFLDRFLDDDVDSSLMGRRREAWEWKKELAALEARQEELSETKDHPNASQILSEAHEVLISLQHSQSSKPSSEDDTSSITVLPTTISSLEQLSASASRELAKITSQITDLRQKIQTQYTDLRQYPYSLHSIFVHRGTSSFGHYWIYIYDFVKEIWRKYNDSTVTEVSHDEVFRDLEKPPVGGGSPATSVYLVYVKEDERNQLVEAVRRDSVSEGTDGDQEMKDVTAPAFTNLPTETSISTVEVQDSKTTATTEAAAAAEYPSPSSMSDSPPATTTTIERIGTSSSSSSLPG